MQVPAASVDNIGADHVLPRKNGLHKLAKGSGSNGCRTVKPVTTMRRKLPTSIIRTRLSYAFVKIEV